MTQFLCNARGEAMRIFTLTDEQVRDIRVALTASAALTKLEPLRVRLEALAVQFSMSLEDR